MHSKAMRIRARINTVALGVSSTRIGPFGASGLYNASEGVPQEKKVGMTQNKRSTSGAQSAVSLLRPRMTDKLNLRPINIINI